MQHVDQGAALFGDHGVAVHHPGGQAPQLGQGTADIKQRYAKQLQLDFFGAFIVLDHPPFPGFEQLWVGERQGPKRRQKQQTAPVDFLPEPRQAVAEQAYGLLRRVLADQLDLPIGQRDIFDRQRGYTLEQRLGAF